jgi:hypothetical protein
VKARAENPPANVLKPYERRQQEIQDLNTGFETRKKTLPEKHAKEWKT